MKLRFDRGSGERNFHGKEHTPISGPWFKHVRLSVHLPSTGHRLIFYFPSGKWWHWDITFDRREYSTHEKQAK